MTKRQPLPGGQLAQITIPADEDSEMRDHASIKGKPNVIRNVSMDNE